MLAHSTFRLFGERHLWSPKAMAVADDLSAEARAQHDEPVRSIHLYLQDIPGAGTVMARIHVAPVIGPDITTAAVRDEPASALHAAFAMLRTRLLPISAVPA